METIREAEDMMGEVEKYEEKVCAGDVECCQGGFLSVELDSIVSNVDVVGSMKKLC